MINKKDKIRGALLGGAVGDALGYQIEFCTNIKEKEFTRYIGKPIVSDDTQMSLFTANALIWYNTNRNKTDVSITDALYYAYKDWYDTQNQEDRNENRISWIKDIYELKGRRAPGNTCLKGISAGRKGTIENALNDGKGCGGVMRSAPIGLFFENPLEAGKVAAQATAITHGNPIAIIPSYCFATIISLLTYTDATMKEAIQQAMKQYEKEFNIFDEKIHDDFIHLVNKAIELSKKDICDIEAIKEIGEGWNGDEAFAIAIYCVLKHPDSFEDAVVCAINHDGDSDSTGELVGNILGTYYGESHIPNYYLKDLELKDVLLEIANDLSISTPDLNNEDWIRKYVDCCK